jgi:PPK2 family polyphosphate:nucleotide phosphotransferase
MNHSKFRIKPGTKVDLAKRDPADKSAVPGNKAERLARLAELTPRIDALQDLLYAEKKHKVLVVLQGMDTAGKDGTIRHVFSAVDPLGVRAVSFRAPAGEELEQDFLWRVHREVPRLGEIAIFNRSHYEDVLIVRVHKWIDADECKRRYQHINGFERMLTENGMTILKFFLHISKDEQKRRLQERIDDPDKHWKFNPDDLRERKRWDDYMKAYEDAIEATSTDCANWYVIPSDSKSTRNLIISSILIEQLEALKMKYPRPAEDYSGIAVE